MPYRKKPVIKEQELSKFLLNTRLNEYTGCIEWTGRKNHKGYGILYCRFSEKMKKAHRWIWERKIGPIEDGMCVLHRCDNPSCVNTDHLWLGTKAENNADCAAKGRTSKLRGEAHPATKIPREVIVSIKNKLRIGKTNRDIARELGVSEPYVSEIKHGKYRRFD